MPVTYDLTRRYVLLGDITASVLWVLVSNGGMAGSTVVSRATVFMSDTFTAMPDWLSDIFLRWLGIFMSYTI